MCNSIDAETGNHLWAERFDKPLADLFDMQDEIVARLANALNTQLDGCRSATRGTSAKPRLRGSLFSGHGLVNKGLTLEHLSQARGFFERALTLDPGNVWTLSGIARVNITVAGIYYPDDRAALIKAPRRR